MARIHRRATQKGLSNPDKHDGVVTHLEPGILKCDIKQTLGSTAANKSSRGDKFHLAISNRKKKKKKERKEKKRCC